jgi:hypothetical protein
MELPSIMEFMAIMELVRGLRERASAWPPRHEDEMVVVGVGQSRQPQFVPVVAVGHLWYLIERLLTARSDPR